LLKDDRAFIKKLQQIKALMDIIISTDKFYFD